MNARRRTSVEPIFMAVWGQYTAWIRELRAQNEERRTKEATSFSVWSSAFCVLISKQRPPREKHDGGKRLQHRKSHEPARALARGNRGAEPEKRRKQH